jgi:DegV family protein with EDD domain
MLRVFIDTGSSIKQEEAQQHGVELLPLYIFLGDQEYRDGVDLSMEVFYHALIEEKLFPKTALPSLGETEERVQTYTDQVDDVIIITISSAVSGTYSAIKMLFADNPRVWVVDSKSAVGGVSLDLRQRPFCIHS